MQHYEAGYNRFSPFPAGSRLLSDAFTTTRSHFLLCIIIVFYCFLYWNRGPEQLTFFFLLPIMVWSTRALASHLVSTCLMTAILSLGVGRADRVILHSQKDQITNGKMSQTVLNAAVDLCDPDAAPYIVACASAPFDSAEIYTPTYRKRVRMAPSKKFEAAGDVSLENRTSYCTFHDPCRVWALAGGQKCNSKEMFNISFNFPKAATETRPIYTLVSLAITTKASQEDTPLWIVEAISRKRNEHCKLLPELETTFKEQHVAVQIGHVPVCQDSLDNDQWTHSVFRRSEPSDAPLVTDWTTDTRQTSSGRRTLVRCESPKQKLLRESSPTAIVKTEAPSSVDQVASTKQKSRFNPPVVTAVQMISKKSSSPIELSFHWGFPEFCTAEYHWCLTACAPKDIGISKIDLIFPGHHGNIPLEFKDGTVVDGLGVFSCKTACSCSIWKAMATHGVTGCEATELTIAATPETPGDGPLLGFLTMSAISNAESVVYSQLVVQPLALPAMYTCESKKVNGKNAYSVSYVNINSKGALPVCETTPPKKEMQNNYLQVWSPLHVANNFKITFDATDLMARRMVHYTPAVACKKYDDNAFFSYVTVNVSPLSAKSFDIPLNKYLEWWNPCDVLQPTCITLCHNKDLTPSDAQLVLPGEKTIPITLRLVSDTPSSKFACSAICGCDLFAAFASAPQKPECRPLNPAKQASVRVTFSNTESDFHVTGYIGSEGLRAPQGSSIAIGTTIAALSQDLSSATCSPDTTARHMRHTVHYVKKSSELMKGTALPICTSATPLTEDLANYWAVWSFTKPNWAVKHPDTILQIFDRNTVLQCTKTKATHSAKLSPSPSKGSSKLNVLPGPAAFSTITLLPPKGSAIRKRQAGPPPDIISMTTSEAYTTSGTALPPTSARDTTTGGSHPPHTTTGGSHPPHTTTGGSLPPHTTTGGSLPPHTTTGGSHPPHTTTGGSSPPSTLPHTTMRPTVPPPTPMPSITWLKLVSSSSRKLVFSAAKSSSIQGKTSIYRWQSASDLSPMSLCSSNHPYVVTVCLEKYKATTVSIQLDAELSALKLTAVPATTSKDSCYTIDACGVWQEFFKNNKACRITMPSVQVQHNGDVKQDVSLKLVISGAVVPTPSNGEGLKPSVAHDSNSAIWIPPKYSCNTTASGQIVTLVGNSNGTAPNCIVTEPTDSDIVLGSIYLLQGSIPVANDFIADQSVTSTTFTCSPSATGPLFSLSPSVLFIAALMALWSTNSRSSSTNSSICL